LIELMIVVTIMASLLALAGPNLGAWLQSSRIRSTTESVLTGLQLAKAEAVSRNGRVRFQLTDTLDNSCVLSTAGRNWIVNLDPGADVDAVKGRCATTPSDTAAPFILQVRAGADGAGASVAAGASSVVFNGLGRLTPVPAGLTRIDISNPAGGVCAKNGGPMTCLRIELSAAGQIRMCNPNLYSPDPQACTP
jgi:type IV fimbrial biogenesis protein FimT